MVYYLPSSNQLNADHSSSVGADSRPLPELADLSVFWGPEICRLQYLIHLLDTGRIKDEYWPDISGNCPITG